MVSMVCIPTQARGNEKNAKMKQLLQLTEQSQADTDCYAIT